MRCSGPKVNSLLLGTEAQARGEKKMLPAGVNFAGMGTQRRTVLATGGKGGRGANLVRGGLRA